MINFPVVPRLQLISSFPPFVIQYTLHKIHSERAPLQNDQLQYLHCFRYGMPLGKLLELLLSSLWSRKLVDRNVVLCWQEEA